jgi:hypothetical protein
MKNASRCISKLLLLVLVVALGCSKDNPIVKTPGISSLDCGGATYSAQAIALASYTAVATVSYSGGNGSPYPASAAIPSIWCSRIDRYFSCKYAGQW